MTKKEIKSVLELVETHTEAIQIERISFRRSGYMTLDMADGRLVYVPLSHFPGIAGLSSVERRRHHIADGEVVLFQDDDEVYHIQDFLGTYEANSYKPPNKQQARDFNY